MNSMEKKLHKTINRYWNSIFAEVWYYSGEHNPITGKPMKMDFCYKKFVNKSLFGIITREPTDETYQRANAWADEVIRMHEENTNTTPVKKELQIAYFGPFILTLNYKTVKMKLKHISHINDIYGMSFDGVMFCAREMNDFQKAAFEELKNRQPELFNENKGGK